MLDEQDLKQIRSMMDEQKEELTQRMDKLEQRMDARMENLEQRMDARMENLEQRMDAQKDSIVSEATRNMQIILENTVMKEIRLLAEGQQLLLETLAPKSRVEALEEDVVFLKQAMRNMAQDIEKLKKAQ